MKQVYNRIREGLKRRKLIVYNYWFCKKKPIKILDTEQTIRRIIDGSCSVCRFGDGELRMIDQNYTIGFQKYDEKLSKRLDEVLNSHNKKVLICLPYTIYSTKHMNPKAAGFWEQLFFEKRSHILHMIRGKKYRREQTYGDSLFTRLYMDYDDKRKSKEFFDLLKNVWKNQEIIIVEGSQSKLGIGNDLFENAKSVHRIIAPTENAFEVYDEILKCCERYCRNKLVFIALGPTATVLAYDLGMQGIHAIDIGHIDVEYEWMIRGCQNKTAIEGKYVNEAWGGRKVITIRNDDYEKQILAKIK